jgi:Ca2+-binding EF-hand superfamily protein
VQKETEREQSGMKTAKGRKKDPKLSKSARDVLETINDTFGCGDEQLVLRTIAAAEAHSGVPEILGPLRYLHKYLSTLREQQARDADRAISPVHEISLEETAESPATAPKPMLDAAVETAAAEAEPVDAVAAEAEPVETAAAEAEAETVRVALEMETIMRPTLVMPSKEERHKLFNQIDGNGNGLLSLAEVDKAVKIGLIGKALSPDAAVGEFDHTPATMRAFQAAEKRGDGMLHRDEFQQLLHFIMYFHELWDMFEGIDRDGDHRVSVSEFEHGCGLIGQSLSAEEAAAEFGKIEEGASGYVLFHEFCRWAAHRHMGSNFAADDEEVVDRSADIRHHNFAKASHHRESSAKASEPAPVEKHSEEEFSDEDEGTPSEEKGEVAAAEGAQRLIVVCPEGAVAGEEVTIQLEGGEELSVVIPERVTMGDEFEVVLEMESHPVESPAPVPSAPGADAPEEGQAHAAPAARTRKPRGSYLLSEDDRAAAKKAAMLRRREEATQQKADALACARRQATETLSAQHTSRPGGAMLPPNRHTAGCGRAGAPAHVASGHLAGSLHAVGGSGVFARLSQQDTLSRAQKTRPGSPRAGQPKPSPRTPPANGVPSRVFSKLTDEALYTGTHRHDPGTGDQRRVHDLSEIMRPAMRKGSGSLALGGHTPRSQVSPRKARQRSPRKARPAKTVRSPAAEADVEGEAKAGAPAANAEGSPRPVCPLADHALGYMRARLDVARGVGLAEQAAARCAEARGL